MIFFGVDPGTARLGWAVIQKQQQSIRPLDYGCLETSKDMAPAQRLLFLYDNLILLLRRFKPDSIAIEELFFATNAKTAISVAQARGIILLASAKEKIDIASYTPLVVKQTITGSGAADKLQVKKMVVRLLHLAQVPQLDDVTDALAIALTHAYSHTFKQKLL